MANNEMITKVEELKELEALIEEATAEANAIRDSIKAEMVARNIEEMNLGKDNPYLSEDEAYRLGLTIKDLFHNSFSEIPKRVVIHKRTPFRKEEIKGLVESLSSAGVKSIDLIEISYEDDLKCFALNSEHSKVKNMIMKWTKMNGKADSKKSVHQKYRWCIRLHEIHCNA